MMTTEQMVDNARKLYAAISYMPKEHEEIEEEREEEKPVAKCVCWDYEFAAKDMKSAALLIGFCKKHGLVYQIRVNGILVRSITNRLVNKARKLANKPTHKYAIKL